MGKAAEVRSVAKAAVTECIKELTPRYRAFQDRISRCSNLDLDPIQLVDHLGN